MDEHDGVTHLSSILQPPWSSNDVYFFYSVISSFPFDVDLPNGNSSRTVTRYKDKTCPEGVLRASQAKAAQGSGCWKWNCVLASHQAGWMVGREYKPLHIGCGWKTWEYLSRIQVWHQCLWRGRTGCGGTIGRLPLKCLVWCHCCSRFSPLASNVPHYLNDHKLFNKRRKKTSFLYFLSFF